MTAVDDLVRMGSAEALNQLLYDSDDFMEQLDAAEGLVKLKDKRGLEFILMASEHDDDEIREVAQEILRSPDVRRYREQLEEGKKASLAQVTQKARLRLQQGKKVYLHKVLFVAADNLLQEDPLGEGFSIPDLEPLGLDGWQIVNVMPRRRQILVGVADDHFTGAYLFLQKEADNESDLPA